MYRQASEMDNVDVRVITRHHVDPVNYPVKQFSLSVVPKPTLLDRILRKLYLAPSDNAIIPNKSNGKWFQSLFEKDRPSAILCQYGPTGIGMSDFATEFKIPLVVHFHGYDISVKLKDPKYRSKLLSKISRWDKCVVVAQYQRDWLLSQGVQDSQIEVVPCGVPIDTFSPGAKEPTGSCQFLAVGRLTPKKNPQNTIRAFDLALKSAPTAHLKIIGDGPLMNECRSMVEKFGICDQVEFAGAQPTAVVRDSMSKASVFVQHSITPESGDMEGWPVALAEAAASGLPIVSTKHASIPEQVIEGASGFLVDEGDWKTMGEKMAVLANDFAMRAAFGEKARDHISQWDTRRQIKLLEQIMLNVSQSSRS